MEDKNPLLKLFEDMTPVNRPEDMDDEQFIRYIFEEELLKSGRTLTSKEIAEMAGIKPGASTANIRSKITGAIERFNLPVAANSKGYFWIETEKQLQKYVDHLDARIAGIERRKNAVIGIFKQYKEGEEDGN